MPTACRLGTLCLLLALLVPASALAARARPAEEHLSLTELDGGTVHDAVLAAPPRSLASAQAGGWGGLYTVGDGERVRVTSSASYPVDETANQKVADFLAGLVHGKELALVSVYVAPLAEVRALCGGGEAEGCYFPGRQQIVVMGQDDPSGLTVEDVLAHEYGHHVANNRLNPPWDAEDWGTKRWASAAGICRRVQTGTAFPGDEGAHYTANPGEAFAESYRVLNELRAGATAPAWPVVNWSFFPDATALAALAQDVTDPWSNDTVRVIRGSFSPAGTPLRSYAVATPYDGSGTIQVQAPPHGAVAVSVSGDGGFGRSVQVAAGGRASLAFSVCGARTLSVTVIRLSGSGRFQLQTSTP